MNGKCVLCKGTKNRKLYLINGYNIVICNTCSLIFTVPWPKKKDLEALYKNFKFEAGFLHEKLVRKDAQRILKNLEKLGYTRGDLLDLGCGAGFLLDEARQKGWKTLGVDTATYPLKHAKEKLKLRVVKKDIHEFNSKKRFDVIILSQVIEHLPNPYPILKRIQSLLTDDGIVCISTPNITSLLSTVLKERFNYLIPPDHVLYFSPITLKQLLQHAGFKSIKTITYGYPEDAGAIYRAIRSKKIKKRKSTNTAEKQTDKKIISIDQSIIKKSKNFLFETVFRNATYPLLNIGLRGSMIEIYVKKIN